MNNTIPHASPTFLTPFSTSLSFLAQNSFNSCASLLGESSCKECPTSGSTLSWNLPCIWPMVNSVSNRSVPARTSSLAVRRAKNFLDMPSNQPDFKLSRQVLDYGCSSFGDSPCQYGSVKRKSVRKSKGNPECSLSSAVACLMIEGQDTLADSKLRRVLDDTLKQFSVDLQGREKRIAHCHLIASSTLLNPFGWAARKVLIWAKASTALPKKTRLSCKHGEDTFGVLYLRQHPALHIQ